MKILVTSINLAKIDKAKIQKTDKNGNSYKDGAMYYPIQIILSDTEDNYGNNVAVCTGQSKEERERKDKRVYLGNGKVVFDSDNTQREVVQEGSHYVNSGQSQQYGQEEVKRGYNNDFEPDPLPF